MAVAVFIAGGLLSGTLGLNSLAGLVETRAAPPPLPEQSPVQPGIPTATPPPPAAMPVLRSFIAPSPTQQPPDPPRGAWLYVIDGNLWESDGRAPVQLTHDDPISQPALGADGLVFVKGSRNASDIWLASPDGPPRPITRNSSPIVSQNHWASQPVFVPGRRDLFVLGDFNKSSTGPGDLAVWELSFGQQALVQITRPPGYAGGDQDVTVDPEDPQRIIFTRYAYIGTELVEQLEWLDVSTNTLVPLTPAEQPSRQASYSPDAKRVAYIQHGSAGHEDLFLADVQIAGGRAELDNPRVIVTGMIAEPVWSADGSALAYLAQSAEGFQLWSVAFHRDAAGSESLDQPHQITHGPGLDATSRPIYVDREQADEVRQWLASSTT